MRQIRNPQQALLFRSRDRQPGTLLPSMRTTPTPLMTMAKQVAAALLMLRYCCHICCMLRVWAAGNWQSGNVFTHDDKAGSPVGEVTFPDTDAQFRESYVGDLSRQKPHGNGILRWRRGNYVRFDGELCADLCC